MKKMNETEQAAMDRINRFKKNQRIYEEYLKLMNIKEKRLI